MITTISFINETDVYNIKCKVLNKELVTEKQNILEFDVDEITLNIFCEFKNENKCKNSLVQKALIIFKLTIAFVIAWLLTFFGALKDYLDPREYELTLTVKLVKESKILIRVFYNSEKEEVDFDIQLDKCIISDQHNIIHYNRNILKEQYKELSFYHLGTYLVLLILPTYFIVTSIIFPNIMLLVISCGLVVLFTIFYLINIRHTKKQVQAFEKKINN